MKVLLDTNVLIDYFAKREPYYPETMQLRIMQEFGDVELWASIQSFSDIAYILRNAVTGERLQEAFLASLSFLRVCSLDQSDLEQACKALWKDFEDCLIDRCSNKLKAEFILSRDSDGFARSSCTVLTPADFFTMISEQYGLTYAQV